MGRAMQRPSAAKRTISANEKKESVLNTLRTLGDDDVIDILSQIGVGRKYFTCHMCGKIKKKDDFYVSADPRSHTKITPICRDCVSKVVRSIDAFGNSSDPTRDSILDALEYIDRPFLSNVYDSCMSKDATDSRDMWSRYINVINCIDKYRGLRFKDSDIMHFASPDGLYTDDDDSDYDQTPMNIEDVDMSQEARDRYEINRRDTIRFVGYDPFENYPIATDKPRLYSQVVNFLDDESKNDGMKLAAIIQIVKRLNQAEKLNDQVDALLNDPKHSLDNQTLINKMIDTCKKNMDIATNLARDNGISINYNNNKSAGQQTLSGKMKKLTEEGLREAKVNLFDVGTCKGMQQVAEISEAARHKQIGVDENVLSEIRDIKVQLVESMRKERDSAQERARILLRENTDLKDYMKERGLMDASGNLVGGDSS